MTVLLHAQHDIFYAASLLTPCLPVLQARCWLQGGTAACAEGQELRKLHSKYCGLGSCCLHLPSF